MSIRTSDYKSHFKDKNFNRIIDDEIESTWSYFMTALDYEQFYRDNFKNFNGKTNYETAELKLKKLFEALNIKET